MARAAWITAPAASTIAIRVLLMATLCEAWEDITLYKFPYTKWTLSKNASNIEMPLTRLATTLPTIADAPSGEPAKITAGIQLVHE